LQGIGALGFVYQDGEVYVGTVAPTLKESNCIFCGTCIEVCPTGALSDKSKKARVVRAGKLKVSLPISPPTESLKFEPLFVDSVPETEGVYTLLDEHKHIIYIKGTMNLHKELKEQLETNGKARYFEWEGALMYTQRESELIQQFLNIHNRLPVQNDELADLF
jgi:ferredoxin